jgi:hypothetical protein
MTVQKDTMTAEERLVATINLEPVDRVVCAPMIDQYAGQFAGITNKDFVWDWEKCMNAINKVYEAFPIWDSNPFIMCERYAPLMKKIGLMRTKMPGVELPDNASFQMHEVEITTQADYDLLIEKGLLAYIEKFNAVAFGTSKEEMIQASIEKGQLLVDEIERTKRRRQSATWGGLGGAAPDVLSMTRSMGCYFKDIIRNPDKVFEAMQVATDEMIKLMAFQVEITGVRRVLIGDSRSSAQWISLKRFEKLLLPNMKRLVNGLNDKNIIPILHLDSDWTKNLEYLLELPAKKFVVQLDGATDIFKAKEILGGHCAIMGDVPAALLTVGTPEKVDEYAKRLITVVGKDGGFIYSSGCCVPMNAKHENMKAFFDAVEKYGRYNY